MCKGQNHEGFSGEFKGLWGRSIPKEIQMQERLILKDKRVSYQRSETTWVRSLVYCREGECE